MRGLAGCEGIDSRAMERQNGGIFETRRVPNHSRLNSQWEASDNERMNEDIALMMGKVPSALIYGGILVDFWSIIDFYPLMPSTL